MSIRDWWVENNPRTYCPDGQRHRYVQESYYGDKVCELCDDSRPGDILPRID